MKSIAILLSLISLVVSARAEILFSGFGPSDSYSTESGAGLGYMFENEKFIRNASQFTINASTSYFFDGIDTAVSGWGVGGTVRFDLMSDSDGLPGTVLESFELIARGVSMTEGEILSARSDLHPILVAGQNYWLAARAESEPFASLIWNLGLGVESPRVTSYNQGPWTPNGDLALAFRISGTVIPEPPTGSLVLAGLLAAAVCRKQLYRSRPR